MWFSALFVLATSLTTSIAQGTGRATYYEGPIAVGACSFTTYTPPGSIFAAALTLAKWDSSAHCGRCVSITGPKGNSITAMIVDKCPGCEPNGIDLLPDGFAQLADPAAGNIEISWDFVKCPIESPLQVHFKDGASGWWFSAQVVGANKGISDLQCSSDGGVMWQGGLTRMDYNYFKKDGGCGDEVTLKVISVDGDEVIINEVPVKSEMVVSAPRNF